MQKEEKQLDSALETIIIRVKDIKTAIEHMLFMLESEHETLNWPNFLDNFAIISGHLTGLSKLLSSSKVPNLRNLTVLPLHLTPERDENLLRVTEGRISTFAHDLVPDYLRTKPDPTIEQKIRSYEAKGSNLTYDAAHKQVAQFNKVIHHISEIANKAREEWESETGSRATQAQTSSTADTQLLVNATGSGKGLVPELQPAANTAGGNIIGGRSGGQTQTSGPGLMVKAPSAIKTNIKAASQLHPYTR